MFLLSVHVLEKMLLFSTTYKFMGLENINEVQKSVHGLYKWQILKYYSLRSILIDSKMDVSRHILVLDTTIWESIKMERREYIHSFKIICTVSKGWN